ncbi:MAG: NAD-dependent epimerase/dehydratase family protein, partial [Thermoanaerobaculia bacterium]
MRYLVTGASGFVGSRLVGRLTAAGEEVTGTYLGGAPRLGG